VTTQRISSERGLPALNQARAERQRRLAAGRFGVRGQLTPHFWLWTGVVLAAFGVIYWKVAQGQLLSQKNAVMAKQRAVAHTLTPTVVPYRDRIERWVMELAGPWQGDRVDRSVELVGVQTAPGVYLRLRINNAHEAKRIRKAAEVSLHDGFVSCMFIRTGAADPSQGPGCKSPSDCAPGLLCNEYDVCSPPPKPYNMRLAYGALRVLSTDWTDELHQTNNDLEVRLRERDLERVAHDDVPIAVQMFQTARYFTLVLDEDPRGGLPAPLDKKETEEQRVQRAAHAARVAVWEFSSGRQLVRLRREAAARAVPVGERSVEHSEAAQQRQVNSCALALAVKEVWQRPAEAPP
jgi:hypothetical protein